MTNTEIQSALDAELAAWGSLPDEVRNKVETSIRSRIESEYVEVRSLTASLNEIASNTAVELAVKLREAADLFESNIDDSVQRTCDAFSDVRESVEGLLETCTEKVPETFGVASELLTNVCEESRNFVETNLIEKLKSSVSDQLERTKSIIFDAKGKIENRFEELITDTKQIATELCETFDRFGAEWKEKVEDVKAVYFELIESVMILKDAVINLVTTIETVMESTGSGMSIATSVLDEFEALMREIV